MKIDFVDHTADIAVRITANDLVEVLNLSVISLGLALVGKLDGCVELEQRGMRYEIEVVSDGPDFTSALVSMLNDILYLVDENRAIPVGFNVRGVHISPDKAEIKGAVILDDGWTASEEVKAVSYSLEWGLLMIFDV